MNDDLLALIQAFCEAMGGEATPENRMDNLHIYADLLQVVPFLAIILQHVAIRARRHRRGLPEPLVQRIQALLDNLKVPNAVESKIGPSI